MTQGVVTADVGDSLKHVGELMRDRNVGSVVICESGRPVGVITDRDLALAVVADRIEPSSAAGDHASRSRTGGGRWGARAQTGGRARARRRH